MGGSRVKSDSWEGAARREWSGVDRLRYFPIFRHQTVTAPPLLLSPPSFPPFVSERRPCCKDATRREGGGRAYALHA